jgi:hypothetical protein
MFFWLSQHLLFYLFTSFTPIPPHYPTNQSTNRSNRSTGIWIGLIGLLGTMDWNDWGQSINQSDWNRLITGHPGENCEEDLGSTIAALYFRWTTTEHGFFHSDLKHVALLFAPDATSSQSMHSKIGTTISTKSAFENSAGVVLTISIERLTETQGCFSSEQVVQCTLGTLEGLAEHRPSELSCDWRGP